ncbi:MAG: hypothetical protein ACE5FG_00415 [Myxococcota bacterium]
MATASWPRGHRRTLRTSLAELAAGIAFPAMVALALVLLLREPFGPLRLAVKSAVPLAALVPAALWQRAGRGRTTLRALAVLAAVTTATLSCVAVLGVPLRTDVLIPFLGLSLPGLKPLLIAVPLLLASVALRLARSGSPRGILTPGELLFAIGESVYFAGFLLTSTQGLGVWSWSIVGSAQLAAASLRGVAPLRALLGSVSLVSMMLWSGTTYGALLVHLALLYGSPLSAASAFPREALPERA